MAKGSNKKSSDVEVKINKLKLFHKNVVEGKPLTQCAEEIGVSRRTLHNYKNSVDYRQLALARLDSSPLGGVDGTIDRLIDALDATKPIVTEDAEGVTSIHRVPDNKTRMDALKEVTKIYGIYAPERTDVKVTVAFSSDEELFSQIEQAERDCVSLEPQQTVEGSTGVFAGKVRGDSGSVGSRQRAILQVDAVSEPI